MLSAAFIGWVPNVQGITRSIAHIVIATVLDHLLCLVVALLAQALKLAVPKQVEVTTMRLDVVGDGGRSNGARSLAEPAKRFGLQLHGAATIRPTPCS